MDKWTRETWLNATLVETYEDNEDITSPAAFALVHHSNILDTERPLRVLDNGTGMGQVITALQHALSAQKAAEMDIVCGDIDQGLLDAVRGKKEINGWENVTVEKIDAMVSSACLSFCDPTEGE